MSIEEQRLEAAEVIRATHRRPGDSAVPSRVIISPKSASMDLVRIEYADGKVREFERLAPDAMAAE